MGGVAYAINDNISADFSYRYIGTSDPTTEDHYGNRVDVEYNAHIISLGVKYTF